MITRTFHEVELISWSERAHAYDNLFAPVSGQAIDDILDGLAVTAGTRHLDVACGPGHLVAAAAARGAWSSGIDFAQPMIDLARESYPQATFRVADARRLPYDDDSFDAVSCAFGLLHIDGPQAAIDEANRVLKRNGRFAFTLWHGADQGNELRQIIRGALAASGATPAPLPPQWGQLRCADRQTCERMTSRAGFGPPEFKELTLFWQAQTAVQLLDAFCQISLRSTMVIESQPREIQRRSGR